MNTSSDLIFISHLTVTKSTTYNSVRGNSDGLMIYIWILGYQPSSNLSLIDILSLSHIIKLDILLITISLYWSKNLVIKHVVSQAMQSISHYNTRSKLIKWIKWWVPFNRNHFWRRFFFLKRNHFFKKFECNFIIWYSLFWMFNYVSVVGTMWIFLKQKIKVTINYHKKNNIYMKSLCKI